MIKLFLKAKHWQLFALSFGIPMVLQIVAMIQLFSGINDEDMPPFGLGQLMFLPVIMVLFMAIHFGWFWSIALGLQSKVPENIKMKVSKFKILFTLPMVYIFLVIVFISSVFFGTINPGDVSGSIVIIIVPLHLLSMFGIFYSLYFVAKTIKTVELQREVSFGDFAGEFFMIWFYPIGIWIIQPKVNKMIENDI